MALISYHFRLQRFDTISMRIHNSLVNNNHKPYVNHSMSTSFRSFFFIVPTHIFIKHNIATIALSACRILPLAMIKYPQFAVFVVVLYVRLCCILVDMLCGTNTTTLLGYYRCMFLSLLLTSFFFNQLNFSSI